MDKKRKPGAPLPAGPFGGLHILAGPFYTGDPVAANECYDVSYPGCGHLNRVTRGYLLQHEHDEEEMICYRCTRKLMGLARRSSPTPKPAPELTWDDHSILKDWHWAWTIYNKRFFQMSEGKRQPIKSRIQPHVWCP